MLATAGMPPALPDTIINNATNSMSNSLMNNASGDGEDPESIKSAVREAARKTQERLAAYQRKQAAKATAAVVAALEPKTSSKEAIQAEGTVSRLQALVSESKRLTNKSKELNTVSTSSTNTSTRQEGKTSPASPDTAKDNTDVALPPPPVLGRSSSLFGIEALTSASTNTAATATTAAKTPSSNKGVKLTELFQTFSGNCSRASTTQSTTKPSVSTSALPPTPSLARSSSLDIQNSNSCKTPTCKTPSKGKKLSAIFQSLTPGGSLLLEDNSAHSMPVFSNLDGEQDKGKENHKNFDKNYNTHDTRKTDRMAWSMREPTSSTRKLITDNDNDDDDDDIVQHRMAWSMQEPTSHRRQKSFPSSHNVLERDDSMQALLGTIVDSGLIRQGSLAKLRSNNSKKQMKQNTASEKPRRDKNVEIDIDIDEDDDDDDDDDDLEEDNSQGSSGEYSIFSLVENKNKKEAKRTDGTNLSPEEIQEMMQDYYNNPVKQTSTADKKHTSLDASFPQLEAMEEAPTQGKGSKKKRRSKSKKDTELEDEKANHKSTTSISSKSKNTSSHAAASFDDSLPQLEAIIETPKTSKHKEKASNPSSAAIELALEDDDDESSKIKESGYSNSEYGNSKSGSQNHTSCGDDMPVLAPFESPNGVSKPKVTSPNNMSAAKDLDTDRQYMWSHALEDMNKTLPSISSSSSNLVSDNNVLGESSRGEQEAQSESLMDEKNKQGSETNAPHNTPGTNKKPGAVITPPSPLTPDFMREEGSMTLSQIFLTSEILPDHASSRGVADVKVDKKTNTPGSNGIGRDPSTPSCSHRKKNGALRRPSLGDVPEEHNENDKDNIDNINKSNASLQSSGRSRGSRKGAKDEDDASLQSSGRSKTSRKSNRSIKSKEAHVKTVGGETVKPGMDVSELSTNSIGEDYYFDDANDDDNDAIGHSRGSLRDGSDDRSTRSARSLSRQGSVRRGRNENEVGRSRSGQRSRSLHRSKSRSETRSKSRSGAHSKSRSASFRQQRQSILENSPSSTQAGDESTRGTSMRDSSRRRSRRRESMRDASMKGSSRRRRSKSTRHSSSKRGSKRATNDEDLSQSSRRADETLNALEASEKKELREEDKIDTIVDDSTKNKSTLSTTNKSLAGLAELGATNRASQESAEGCDQSVSDSMQSAAGKKSRMSKLAKSVGRRLTLKKGKGKSKSGGDNADENTVEDNEALDLDSEIEVLNAAFEEEENQLVISVSLPSTSFEDDASRVESDDVDLAADGAVKRDSSISSKSKKKRTSVFGKIKKVGSKIKKKNKKKDKKGNDKINRAEALDSDSESDNDELLGSEYSGGTLDRSQSGSYDDEEHFIEDPSGNFVQLQFEGDKASITMCGSDRAKDSFPVKTGRPRRASLLSTRRQRADRQRSQSLHAMLDHSEKFARGDDSSLQQPIEGLVMTSESKIRNRRNQSVRGHIQGHGKGVNVKKAESVQDTVEKNPNGNLEKSKNMKRCKSLEAGMATKMNVEKDEKPSFDWAAYSTEKEAVMGKQGKDKRKSKTDKRLSGGLSKLVFHHQTVAN